MKILIIICAISLAWSTVQVDGSIGLSDHSKEIQQVKDELQDELAKEKQIRLSLQTQLDQEISARKDQQLIFEHRISMLESQLEFSQDPKAKSKYDSELSNLQWSRAESSHDEHGCLAETIHLSCLAGATVQVTNATFGIYNATCNDACCQPDPSNDCSEFVSQNSPEDWTILQTLCDGQTSCGYDYTGSVIDECEPGYIADYMHIFYDCLGVPEPTTTTTTTTTTAPEIEQIGFTAHATISSNYYQGEKIRFGLVQSNFGGYYDASSSTFNCPYSGIYLFSVSINTANRGWMNCGIMRDLYPIAEAFAESIDGMYSDPNRPQASALAIVECTAGQEVWATALISSYLYVHTIRANHFSGYLLHPY